MKSDSDAGNYRSRANIFIFLALSLTIISCENTREQNVDEDRGNTVRSANNDVQIDPCSIFTIDDLRTGFDIDKSVDVVTDQTGNFPTCGYTWNAGRKRNMKVGGSEIEVNVENRVTIVIVGNATEQMYQASIRVYPETTPLDLGEMSVWSDTRSQLTLLEKGYLIHVNVDVFDAVESNRNKAILLAGDISAKL